MRTAETKKPPEGGFFVLVRLAAFPAGFVTDVTQAQPSQNIVCFLNNFVKLADNKSMIVAALYAVLANGHRFQKRMSNDRQRRRNPVLVFTEISPVVLT
ncbi:hypothetical protein J1778_17760 [Rahnella sp. H11b]|uniref:Uncharacterized protein n=1 Tax=Rahnella bonaserana TaxID=2816248 RepID=A0ABS6LYQ8_9GAMM|nr:hypothetical protein [Rahnella bonaserana]